MKILAIGAHADDVEMGCGGSLLKWAREGHEIVIFVATKSGYAGLDGTVIRSTADATDEAKAAAAKIGARLIIGETETFELATGDALNSVLLGIVEDFGPDLVLTHWDGDVHNDHRVLALASLHACRHVGKLLMYISNHYLGSATFDPRFAVDISATLEDKLDLIQIFASEFARTGGQWAETVRHRAALTGTIWNVAYAEAFMAVRYLMA